MSGYSEKELLDAGMVEPHDKKQLIRTGFWDVSEEELRKVLAELDTALMKSQTKVNPFTPADHKEFNFGKFM